MPQWRADQLPPPSPAVANAAAAMRLGGFVATHNAVHSLFARDPKPVARRKRLILVVVTVLLASMVLALTAFGNGNGFLGAVLLVPPAAGLVVAIMQSYRVRKAGPQPHEIVHQFQQGLACPSPDGAVALRWDDIAQIYDDVTDHYRDTVYTHTSHRYTLVATNGWKIVLAGHGLDKNPKRPPFSLAPVLQQEVTQRLLSAAGAQISAGRHVAFGEVTIGPHGVATLTDSVPWSRVTGVTVKYGAVTVEVDGGKWWSQRVKAVPNLQVFWSLAQHLRSAAHQQRH
jgi:hypothetical protein